MSLFISDGGGEEGKRVMGWDVDDIPVLCYVNFSFSDVIKPIPNTWTLSTIVRLSNFRDGRSTLNDVSVEITSNRRMRPEYYDMPLSTLMGPNTKQLFCCGPHFCQSMLFPAKECFSQLRFTIVAPLFSFPSGRYLISSFTPCLEMIADAPTRQSASGIIGGSQDIEFGSTHISREATRK